MAIIRDELTLIDRFTSVFEKFINLGADAVDQADQIGAAADAVGDSLGNISQSFNSAQDDIAEAVQVWDEYAQSIIDATSEQEFYSDQLRSVQSRLNAQATQLNRASREYINLKNSANASTAELEKQYNRVLELTDSVKLLTAEEEELIDTLNELGDAANNGGNGVDGAGDSADRAADKFDRLVGSVARLAAGFISLRQALKFVGDAYQLSTYELRFESFFGGEEYGAAAISWITQLANQYNETVQDVASTTSKFLQLTTDTSNIEGLIDLTARLAAFSDRYDFDQTADVIQRALLNGSLGRLAYQTGISKGLLNQFGVTEAAETGDVEKFIDALSRAADAAGFTQEAFERILEGPEAQWDRFVNRFQNGARAAARGFVDEFTPAVARFNSLFDSEQGLAFFNGLTVAAMAAGMVVGGFLDILGAVASFVGGNMVPIFIAAGAAAAIFAAQLAIAAASALLLNLPLLGAVALVTLFIYAAMQLGLTVADVFGTIAGVFGGFYVFAYNIFAELWNFIATFAEALGRIFDDPVAAIVQIFVALFDFVLGTLTDIAKLIDLVFGSDLAGALNGWRQDAWDWYNENFGATPQTIDRIERLDIEQVMRDWEQAGRELGDKVDNFNPDDIFSDLNANLDLINGFEGFDKINVGTVDKIKSGEISLADEDLRRRVDLAERSYVAQVNVNTMAPNIEVTVTSVNGEPIEAEDIANRIKEVLDEQANNATDTTYPD